MPAQPSVSALLFAPLVLSLIASPVWSQDDPVYSAEPVIVTATRTPQTVDDSLASVSVIGRADIDRRQAATMADVLRGLPGVTLSSNGGLGHTTNVYLRGTRPDHVLLLVDGIQLGTVTSGFLPWAALPLGPVEQIEVVRGPASSLYGSEALGGVVQVFTRRGEPGPLTPRFRVMAGHRGTVEADFGLSGGTTGALGEGWLNASIGFVGTDGFNVCDGPEGCGVAEPDDDGYENANALLRAGWRLSDRLEVDLTYLRSAGELEYDGSRFYGNEKESEIEVLSTRVITRPTAPWTLTLRAGRSWDDAEIFAGDTRINRLDTTRDQLSVQNDFAVAPTHLVTIGLDYERDHLDTLTDYAVTERDNTGLFGQYLGGFGAHNIKLGLRYDDNEQFGDETTGNIAWGYTLASGLRLTASAGTAFKAPTFNDLYYPGYGNPHLEPEQSWSAELGLAGEHLWGEWSVNAYQTEIDDLIAFDAATYSPQNIERARIRGLELWSTADLAGWLMSGTVTLLDPRNRSDGPNDGQRLPRRPEQTLRLDADRSFGRIGLGGTLFVSGRRFDDDENQVRLDGFTLVDLRAEYAFNDELRLQGRVENLLDEDYETAASYNQPGRAFFVTLLYQP